LDVAWTGHAQRMAGSCKNVVTAALANFGVGPIFVAINTTAEHLAN